MRRESHLKTIQAGGGKERSVRELRVGDQYLLAFGDQESRVEVIAVIQIDNTYTIRTQDLEGRIKNHRWLSTAVIRGVFPRREVE